MMIVLQPLRLLWLAVLSELLLAARAFGQVPQDMTHTGRLVDNLGARFTTSLL